jgi:hypothetical protein
MRVLILMTAALLGGCAGYNLDVGTSGNNVDEFQSVYTVPASSLRPWAERQSEPALQPPPDGGASGTSTLPPARGDLAPDRPQPKPAG